MAFKKPTTRPLHRFIVRALIYPPHSVIHDHVKSKGATIMHYIQEVNGSEYVYCDLDYDSLPPLWYKNHNVYFYPAPADEQERQWTEKMLPKVDYTDHLPKISREEVYRIIDTEREYQIKNGEEALSPAEFITLIHYYCTKAERAFAIAPGCDRSNLIQIITRKIAALAVASMETNGAEPREESPR